MKGIKQQIRDGKVLPLHEGSEKLIEDIKEFLKDIEESREYINGRFTKRKPQD